jgi:hypothetical protein
LAQFLLKVHSNFATQLDVLSQQSRPLASIELKTETIRDSSLHFHFAALPPCHGRVALDATDSSAVASRKSGIFISNTSDQHFFLKGSEAVCHEILLCFLLV